MKHRIALAGALIALAALTAVAVPLTARAGTTGDTSSLDALFTSDGTALSPVYWEGTAAPGVEATQVNGKNAVRFTPLSDAGSPLTYRSKIVKSDECPETLSITFTLEVTELTGSKRFGLGLGVPRLDGDAGDAGSTFIGLRPATEGYTLYVSRFGDTETELGAVSVSAQPTISVTAWADGRLSVKADEESISTAAGSVNPEGFICFTQFGLTAPSNRLDVSVTAFDMLNVYYDKPENADLIEKFDDSEFNAAGWYLKSVARGGRGVVVTDEKLTFDGAGQNSVFAARFPYSNFRFVFDASDFANTGWADGQDTYAGTLGFSVSFGTDSDDVESAITTRDNAVAAGPFLTFETRKKADGKRATRLAFYYKGSARGGLLLDEKYNFLNEDFADTLSMSLEVADGTMTVGFKTTEEIGYTEVYRYAFDSGFSPRGYVAVWGESNHNIPDRTENTSTSCRFDNLALINLDRAGNASDVDYVSSVDKPTGDYEYHDSWSDADLYRPTDKGCGGAAAGGSFLLAAVAAALCPVFCRRRKA